MALFPERRPSQAVVDGLPLGGFGRYIGRQINRNPIDLCIVGFVQRDVKPCGIIPRGERHLDDLNACAIRRPRVL